MQGTIFIFGKSLYSEIGGVFEPEVSMVITLVKHIVQSLVKEAA